ncbi:hypothetical protein [Neisseria dentiae]|uniref:hypothetical protein n=1 Tax=Neisseria dentiae TaxID=194197 RepID=UPI0035A1B2AC
MKPRLTTITATLLLAACSAPPETGRADSQPANKETVKMSENKTPPTTQREILERMLEMMKTSESIKDFTRERLEQVFGIKMKSHEDAADSYYFFSPLEKNWEWSLNKYKTIMEKQDTFRLSFNLTDADSKNYTTSKIIDITKFCEIDFYDFVKKSEAIGFISDFKPEFMTTPEENYKNTIEKTGLMPTPVFDTTLEKDNLRVNIVSYTPIYIKQSDTKSCIRHILFY